ncbi:MAG: hypothetical protein EP329_11875 [Deltaproteobacteria bacterium]|nr:MAG: hypothetical protein EP329_11875 [Deltaproteobacteria bacterium]
MTLRLLLALALVLGVSGCPDDTTPDTDTVSDTATAGDADVAQDTTPPGRPLLGGRAEIYDITKTTAPRPWVASTDALGGDLTEVIVIPLDLYGIPWSSFSGPDNQPVDLPGPWVSEVNALKAMASSSGKRVVLALSPLSPDWDTLAPEAREQSGVLVLNSAWRESCYNPANDANVDKWRDAYAGYTVWAVKQFAPDWVVLGQRMNRYEENCGVAAYTAVLDYPAEAHRRIKELKDVTPPPTIVGVDVEDLYGYPTKAGRCVAVTPEACLAQRKGLVDGITADYLGLESYPAFALEDLAAIPNDWLAKVADLRSDLGAAIIGTSLPAQSMTTQRAVCGPLFDSSEALQTQWLDQAVATAKSHGMPLVIWRSVRDLFDADVVSGCPCTGDTGLCQHLAGLGAGKDDVRPHLAAGLVTVDGTERAAVSVWRQALVED